jgi:uncharacterized protein YjbJ (UPF0337 family)
MSNEQDIIASTVESQNDGQLDTEVGQDEGTNNEESSTVDWEAQAKYMQSEKDKLYAENQQIKAKVQEYLDSRKSEQPSAPEKIALKPDEFDPWEAYNDPSSASYKFRMQEMQETINGAVDQAVGGIKAQQGRTSLHSDLIAKGLNEEEVNSFFEFADKHPSEYGLDNVLKMWRAVSQPSVAGNQSPLDQVRDMQSQPTAGGLLQGQKPQAPKNDEDATWDGIMGAATSGRLP